MILRRRQCKSCGKSVAVRQSGVLWKHWRVNPYDGGRDVCRGGPRYASRHK